jgi:cellobiose phosphorylase
MYRLITESFLGMKQEGNKLTFIPCVPQEWESYKVHYRYRNTVYHITVLQNNSKEEMRVDVDGMNQDDNIITLIDDNTEHQVEITISRNVIQKSKESIAVV